jgi:hypothetical protein
MDENLERIVAVDEEVRRAGSALRQITSATRH